MEFLARIFEIFLWAVFLVWLVRRVAGLRARSTRAPRVERRPAASLKTLYQDPVCGIYVAEDISCKLEESGKTLHFCSKECRMRYLARQHRAAGA